MSASGGKVADREGGPTGTVRCPRAWAVLVVVTILGLAADLVTKEIAFDRLAPVPVVIDRAEVVALMEEQRRASVPLDLSRLRPSVARPVIPYVLEFTLVLNPGAVFGIGAGQRWVFVGFTVAAIAFAGWMFARWTRPREHVAQAGIALLLAGGLGNLYDRLVFACVRDFIHPLPRVAIGGWEVWPYVSNVADLLLLIGIGILLWHVWRTGEKRPKRSVPAPGSSR